MTNWKDIAIGAASTLAVTVISGIVIYYLTKEPPAKGAAERLVYEIQRTGEFQSATTKVAPQTIRVANLGDAAATQVRAVIEYPPGVEVVDKVASMSSGPAGVFSTSAPSAQLLEFVAGSLTPGESLTVSVVLNQGVQTLPKVGVKSDRSIGTAGELLAQPVDEKSSTVTRVAAFLLPA